MVQTRGWRYRLWGSEVTVQHRRFLGYTEIPAARRSGSRNVYNCGRLNTYLTAMVELLPVEMENLKNVD